LQQELIAFSALPPFVRRGAVVQKYCVKSAFDGVNTKLPKLIRCEGPDVAFEFFNAIHDATLNTRVAHKMILRNAEQASG
jgi:hypothetical protein